jgi:hypothetical protein
MEFYLHWTTTPQWEKLSLNIPLRTEEFVYKYKTSAIYRVSVRLFEMVARQRERICLDFISNSVSSAPRIRIPTLSDPSKGNENMFALLDNESK